MASNTAVSSSGAGLVPGLTSVLLLRGTEKSVGPGGVIAPADVPPSLPVWDSVGVFGPGAARSEPGSQKLHIHPPSCSDGESSLLVKQLRRVPTPTGRSGGAAVGERSLSGVGLQMLGSSGTWRIASLMTFPPAGKMWSRFSLLQSCLQASWCCPSQPSSRSVVSSGWERGKLLATGQSLVERKDSGLW